MIMCLCGLPAEELELPQAMLRSSTLEIEITHSTLLRRQPHAMPSKLVCFIAIVSVVILSADPSVALSGRHSIALDRRTISKQSQSLIICRYAVDEYVDDESRPRRVPTRALPHVQISSQAEEASRAGYIIRRNLASCDDISMGRVENHGNNMTSRDGGRRVRPLRIIRKIVLRRKWSTDETITSVAGSDVEVKSFNEFITDKAAVGVRYGLRRHRPDFPLSKRTPTIHSGSNRVTFRASREASHAIQTSWPTASAISTLTEYMSQPVEQYSLLSFHDDEPRDRKIEMPSSGGVTNISPSKARRWLVRRLTAEESLRHINNSTSATETTSSVDASNFFRLAVPLQPIIGWDLTPVIDLEVIPPEVSDGARRHISNSNDIERVIYEGSVKPSTWARLKRIRHQVGGNKDSDIGAIPPVVKIRSLGVSLLSTQDEVHAAMLGKPPNVLNPFGRHYSSKMQEEAIGMVGKVEEWLKPHITFEAELSWTENNINNVDNVTSFPPKVHSTVSVKSTAVTSLTIPRLPTGILHATVPSAFLVKRLGSTLTSKALEVCLPRFLRQLERDYYRWLGLVPMSSESEEVKQ